MQQYTGFAQVYDTFMDNVPYDEWSEYLTGLLLEYGVKDGLVLELGCGTGNITRRLASKGYDMIGLDNSEEMLEIARDKEYEEREDSSEREGDRQGNGILYLQQDMRRFELYGTVAGVVSICDSMNYITSERDMVQVFRLVNNYLDAGAIFIFDMNTEYKYENVLSDNTIAENREDCSFIWENCYDKNSGMNEYDVTVFVRIDEEGSKALASCGRNRSNPFFERFRETHYQKAYSVDAIKRLLAEAELEFVAAYDAFTHNPPADTSERVYFIAREKHQENKKYV